MCLYNIIRHQQNLNLKVHLREKSSEAGGLKRKSERPFCCRTFMYTKSLSNENKKTCGSEIMQHLYFNHVTTKE